MKIEVYKDPHVEGIVPREIEPINAADNIVLSYNSEDGYSVAEVIDAVELFFICPTCGSAIKVNAIYRPSTSPKRKLVGVINAVTPVYCVERTEGFIYYKWMCCDDKGIKCDAAYGWRGAVPPRLKPISDQDKIK